MGLKVVCSITATLAVCLVASAQAPGVAVPRDSKESLLDEELMQASKAFFNEGRAVKLERVKEELKRKTCSLALVPIKTKKLPVRDIFLAAQASHLRVGWAYLCDRCEDWHLNLAGGYVLSTNGAVATCYHVVKPPRFLRAGCLVAADEAGKVFAVTEVLACDRNSDACIVRVACDGLKPLALNTNVYPGDSAYCFSDPLDHRGYFSSGIINRFYQLPGRRPIDAPESASIAPTRLDVSTDWAPGSSGSAVLDECGNVIGHATSISRLGDDEPEKQNARDVLPRMIVFHQAVSARDILRLIQMPPGNAKE